MAEASPRLDRSTARGAVAQQVAAVAVVVGGLSWSAVLLGAASDGVALWWPAAGASVAAVVLVRPSIRPWIVLVVVIASAAGNVLGGRPLLISVAFGLANAAEAAVAGWWLVRGGSGRPALSTLPDLWRLLIAALMGATVLAVGATLTVIGLDDGSGWPTFVHVLASHASAVLLLVPLVLRQTRRAAPAGWTEASAQVAVTVALAMMIFGFDTGIELPFVILAPLIWAALRLSLRMATVEVVITLIVALNLSALGFGPLSGAGIVPGTEAPGAVLTLDFIVMQAFVATTFTVVMVVAIVANGQRSLLDRLERRERILRGGFNDALLGTAILQPSEGHIDVVEINQVASELLGSNADRIYPHQGIFGARSDEVGSILRDIAGGRRSGYRAEIELPSVEGRQRWAEVSVSPLSDNPGLIVMHLVDTTARKALESRLEHVAIHDALTGLPNRMLLRDRIERAMSTLERTGQSITVLFLDVDDFKQINDTAGHEVGDEILREVARRLTTAIRRSDTVARLGGDEFVILLPAADRATVDSLLARLRGVLDQQFTVSSGTYRVTASIGITPSEPGSTVDQLLRDADTAMYVSKRNGRGLATWFDPSFRERAMHAATVVAEFDGAIDRGEVFLHVQPIIELTSGRIAAAEALVRWQHPAHGLWTPGHWLDIVNSGPAGQWLEQWILTQACEVLTDWYRRWGDDCPALHVNVSNSAAGHGDLAGLVETARGLSGAPATKLVVELTESAVESDHSSLVENLNRLRDAGVRISVDDFGTGYSALSRLAQLPLDELKIDQSFVQQVLTDDSSRGIVNAIVGLAEALHLPTVAEGIESEEQADYLRDLGCSRGQGYLWGRPGTVDGFVRMVDRALQTREHSAVAHAGASDPRVPAARPDDPR